MTGGAEAEAFPPETAPLILPADEFALVKQLQARLDELENAVNWGTSCLSCARVLDSSKRGTTNAPPAPGKSWQPCGS